MASAVTAKKEKMMVAAIDFGTTYSGYAFSLKTDYNADPTKISINQGWVAGSMAVSSYKAPTVVLFDQKGEFNSFGYEAEDAYSELALDNEHHDWYYFSRFKMRLHHENNQKIHRDMDLQDDKGRKLPAITVFGKVIWYLKDHMLKALKKRGTEMKNEDIHWIITVPAIWADSAKQFMREAAYKADIAGSQLTIALEPEAASLYCQYLPTEKIHGTAGLTFDVASTGSKYMVIDLGGGTADITVHERHSGGGLKEVHKASGGAWGGTRVDEAFKQMLIKIIGAPVLDKFCEEHRADYLYLQRELEVKKRTMKPSTSGKITLKVPVNLREAYTKETGESIEDAIKGSPYAGKLVWHSDKIRLDATIFKGLFKDCIDKIVEHIRDLLNHPEVKGTDLMLMVGGFSESEMMHDAIENAFKKCRVIIPEDAGLCVMKGAVIFGHRPVAITSRVSRYTYGINISPPFDPNSHPESHKVTIGGRDRCQNVFKSYIREGESIRVGEERSGRHITLNTHQTEMLLNIFASPKKTPQFVDEPEVELLGQVVVQLPDRDELIKVEVKMIFGETELHVEAQEMSTNNKYTSFFDFL
ncbi:heat shock 70 kDa protein 12A-like [Dreissena polymorpha]|uniref:heat shock 70 kDa protein 12A-like n=1 Tax=Dreissena polymorpha TaxID=45954 RepID=UPI0022651A2E|nr:heat shock 70 kDa protein 12A-like [Dreissena polymorpha]XP_052280103.1 heat shock 70 kDa protein 12A-like [Dreissena polymorpha]